MGGRGRVKGLLFVDYVRMLRAHRDLSWGAHLKPEDQPFLQQTIDPSGWYPMETFERLGIAILQTVAGGDLGLVRHWGRFSVAHVAGILDTIVVAEDPRESLMRFFVMRRSLFDFEALSMLQVSDGSASVQVQYGMGDLAEQAAAVQTMGFFEGLLELADATGIEASFTESAWRGDPRTVLSLAWQPPLADDASLRDRASKPPASMD